MLKASEDTLQRYVKDLMDSPRADPRVVWFHVPNERSGPVQVRVKLKKLGVLAGVADCVFLLPDREWSYLLLELKYGAKGRQSDAQKEFQRRVEVIGGVYEIARSPAEIDGVLSAFGIITRPGLKLARAA